MGRPTRNPLKRLAIAAASTGVTLSLVSGIGGPATAFTARAASYAVQPIAAIAELPSSIGIAEGYDFYAMDEAQIDRTLDAMESLGVKSIRLGVFWAAIEPQEGVYDWDKLDLLVAKATERDMGILGTILYTPAWASADPESQALVNHPDPEKFGDFVGVSANEVNLRVDHLVHADEVRPDHIPVHMLEGQVQVVVAAELFLQQFGHLAALLVGQPGDGERGHGRSFA